MKFHFHQTLFVSIRVIAIITSLILIWWIISLSGSIPVYLLPSPFTVILALKNNQHLLWLATFTTIQETLIGLVIGCIFGMLLALLMIQVPLIRHWLMPIIIISQSIPTFALAPLLVLWLGFGINSKIVMTVLMIFFPVTSSFFDGLNRTPQGWLDLSKTMNASRFRQLFFIRIPAALPAFSSGLKIAAAISPIGAVIGEWVGASSGLGYLMQNANSRFQTDLMFAALLILSLMTISLWGFVTIMMKIMVPWLKENND